MASPLACTTRGHRADLGAGEATVTHVGHLAKDLADADRIDLLAIANDAELALHDQEHLSVGRDVGLRDGSHQAASAKGVARVS